MESRKSEQIGTYVTIRNESEARFVRIVEGSIENIGEYWAEENAWKKVFEEEGCYHWMFQQLQGQLSAMFYMDIIKEPVSVTNIYLRLKGVVDMKKTG